MRERTLAILTALTREFIETGEPVSSGALYDRYEFGIKPAMIRAELNELTEDGYLEQPHQSSGRVPTDKSYELFAERALEATLPTARIARTLKGHRSLDSLLERIAEELGAFEVVSDRSGRTLEKEGLEQLVGNLEWDSRDAITAIIRDIESLDERLEAAAFPKAHDDFLAIFIGSKSPITRSHDLAVIAGDYRVNGERVIVWSIGPKRMDYERAAQLFKGLKLLYS